MIFTARNQLCDVHLMTTEQIKMCTYCVRLSFFFYDKHRSDIVIKITINCFAISSIQCRPQTLRNCASLILPSSGAFANLL